MAAAVVRAMVLAVALALPGSLPATAQSLEYPVKAAYLVNFVKFTEWPAGHWPAANAPIVIGVLGGDEMVDALVRVAGTEPVRGHRLEVRRVEHAASFNGQMLYAGVDAPNAEVAALTGRAGVLVVGETSPQVTPGATIRFFLKDRSVRFEVSLEQAKRAGVSLSSRLLKVAHVLDAGETR